MTRSTGRAGLIVVAGAVAQRLGVGGHAWVFLQYLLGFERLGYDVVFVDRVDDEVCTRPAVEHTTYLFDLTDRFGLAGKVAALGRGRSIMGMPRAELSAAIRDSALLLNVMGYLQDEELLVQAPRTVFLDIDPGFGQWWAALGLSDPFVGHDHHITFGRNIGRPRCDIPTLGLDWITTDPPVVLSRWAAAPARRHGPVSSVATWRGPFAPIDTGSSVYGLRAHLARSYAGVPDRVPQRCELALAIDAADGADRRMLAERGWSLADPTKAAGTPEAYRSYIEAASAELCLPKQLYAATNSGWFSDRSACYLATGRPVVAVETGFSDHHPTGDGLIAVDSPAAAALALVEVDRHHAHHSRAARRVAESDFDSDVVLGKLLAALGI